MDLFYVFDLIFCIAVVLVYPVVFLFSALILSLKSIGKHKVCAATILDAVDVVLKGVIDDKQWLQSVSVGRLQIDRSECDSAKCTAKSCFGGLPITALSDWPACSAPALNAFRPPLRHGTLFSLDSTQSSRSF